MTQYTITTTLGDKTFNIPRGSIDSSSSSLNLVGRAAPGYGLAFAQNQILLLNNNASPASGRPAHPLLGQLWYNSDAHQMQNFVGIGVSGADSNGWAAMASTTSSSVVLPISGGGTGATSAPAALINLGAVAKAGDTMTGALTLPSYLAVTATSGEQRVLVGNQNSGGANKPGILSGLNGIVRIGTGSTWTGNGGTLTIGLSVDTSATNGLTFLGNTVYHAGNLNLSTAATANTVAVRDGSGDLFARYLNTAAPNGENPTISQVFVSNGTDGYLRKSTIASLTSQLSGTAPISITGTASQATLALNATNATNANIAAHLLQGGTGTTAMTFNWAGQSGTPPWLWGGSDGVNHYVYAPSQLHVATADNAGHASTADSATTATSATSAGSVPWTGVTGHPTAVSAFTNDSGYITASNAPVRSVNGATGAVTITAAGIGAAPLASPALTGTPTVNGQPILTGAFTESRATNGYTKLPTGLIMQWATGIGQTSEGDQTINFPIPFPSTVLNIQASCYFPQDTNQNDGNFQIVRWTNSSVVVRAQDNVGGWAGNMYPTIFVVGY